jgi:hypothetical protein
LFFGAERASGRGLAALEFKFSIEIVRAHGGVVRCPSEERGVETFGGVLIGGVEFDPAEVAGGVLIDVCHGGRSLHLVSGDGLSGKKYCFNRCFGSGDEKCFTTENTEIQGTLGLFRTLLGVYT